MNATETGGRSHSLQRKLQTVQVYHTVAVATASKQLSATVELGRARTRTRMSHTLATLHACNERVIDVRRRTVYWLSPALNIRCIVTNRTRATSTATPPFICACHMLLFTLGYAIIHTHTQAHTRAHAVKCECCVRLSHCPCMQKYYATCIRFETDANAPTTTTEPNQFDFHANWNRIIVTWMGVAIGNVVCRQFYATQSEASSPSPSSTHNHQLWWIESRCGFV